MTPLELAIVLSAVDNASRAITQVQEKLEGLANVGDRMTAIGERITFAGLIRTAGDVLGVGDTARSAMSFQDEIARVNTALPPTAAGIKQLGETQEFAIAQLQHHAYAAWEVAESVYKGLSNFLSARQAMAAAAVAGSALAEMMNASGRGAMEKLGIPVARSTDGVPNLHGTLRNLAEWIRAHPRFGAAEQLTKAFVTRAAGTELLLSQLSKLDDAQKALECSSGAVARVQQIAESTASERYQILRNNLEAVAERLADVALPALTRWIDALSGATHAAADFLARHQAIASVLAAAGTALGVLTTAAGGLLLTLGPITIAGGYALKLLGSIPAGIGAIVGASETLCLRWLYLKDAIAGMEIGTKLWAAAQWVLDAALSPTILTIGGIVVGAAALGLAAYEIYEHWSAVKNSFVKVWEDIKHTFSSVVDWMKTSGLNMMKTFGEGILAGLEYPFKAAWQVAQKIGGLFHFHSLQIEGPLREALLNFHLGEELARHLKLAPLIVPAVQMASAIALPFAQRDSASLLSVPIIRSTAAMAMPRAGRSITVNYSPTITVQGSGIYSSRDEWVKAARQHADELMRIIDSKLNRRSRLEFA